MDDHFWPSMYPGIIVGLLMGLAWSRMSTTLAGAIGGLAGAAAHYFISLRFGLPGGLFSLVMLVAAAALGSYLLIEVVSRRKGPALDKR